MAWPVLVILTLPPQSMMTSPEQLIAFPSELVMVTSPPEVMEASRLSMALPVLEMVTSPPQSMMTSPEQSMALPLLLSAVKFFEPLTLREVSFALLLTNTTEGCLPSCPV